MTFSQDVEMAHNMIDHLSSYDSGNRLFREREFLRELERLGWKIVGPEPSQKMLDAGYYPAVQRRGAKSVYSEMLAASPSVDELLEGEK